VPINTNHDFTDEGDFEVIGAVANASIDQNSLFADCSLFKKPKYKGVSLGYRGDVIKKDGVHDGVSYTHVFKSIRDIDHVSITPTPRSPSARFLDDDRTEVFFSDSFEIDFSDELEAIKDHKQKKEIKIMDHTEQINKMQEQINGLNETVKGFSVQLKDSVSAVVTALKDESEKAKQTEIKKSAILRLADSKGINLDNSKAIEDICSDAAKVISEELKCANIGDSYDSVMTALQMYSKPQKKTAGDGGDKIEDSLNSQITLQRIE
jgi:hypothetical protein